MLGVRDEFEKGNPKEMGAWKEDFTSMYRLQSSEKLVTRVVMNG